MKTKIIYFFAAFLLTIGQAHSMLAHRYDFRSAIHDSDSFKACEKAKAHAKDIAVCNQSHDVVGGKPIGVKQADECQCRTTQWQDNPVAQECSISVQWDCETTE
jgi:hypothetical protein